MKISKIRANEFHDVLRLNEACIPHVNSIDDNDLQWFTEHAAFAVVAKIDDRFAGFLIGLRPGTAYKSVNYRWFCDHRTDFAYIDRVAVDDWARRRGVAESLYAAFAEAEKDAPAMTCEVNIEPPNPGSMAFHERLGFRQIGSQATDGGHKTVALLEKPL